MRKLLSIIGVLLLSNPAFVHGIEVSNNITVSGYLKNATALKTHEFDESLKIRSTVQIEAEYRLQENLHIFGIVREFYDSVFDAESEYRQNRHPVTKC